MAQRVHPYRSGKRGWAEVNETRTEALRGIALKSPPAPVLHWPHPVEERREHSDRDTSGSGLLDISLIVPTRNEAGNIATLVGAVRASLEPSERTWELIFVDDSDDETPDRIRRAAARTPNVSLIHRPPGDREGGLSSAVIMGYKAARGRALVVMDGDLQHPPELARCLAAPVLSGEADLVIASRYVSGASSRGLEGFRRRAVSVICTLIVHLLVPASRKVRDPLSGFFALSRHRLDEVGMRPHGFKILLEVLASSDQPRIMEVPFMMGERLEGDSKAGIREGARFARHLGRIVAPSAEGVGRIVIWGFTQIPLGAILAVQYWLSEKLIYRNTAFVDEATYLSAGHYEIYSWSHPHAADMHLATYFSGAPTIYPVIAAWVDSFGGLTAARYLSFGFMVITTLAIYAAGKRLWGRPGGWLSAGLWVTTQGVQFLGSFATYDAMALMLITVAGWAAVRAGTASRVSSWIYMVAPILVLANATKYATALYDPVVIALAFFVIAAYHSWRMALRTAAILTACIIIGISAALALAPPAYLAGIESTTLQRAASNASVARVLGTSWSWIGAIAVVCAFAAVLAAIIWATLRPYSRSNRSRRNGALIGVMGVGAVAVWLAPLNQARIHTETSLSKHVTFGAWFAALGAGWLFSHLLRRDGNSQWWRYLLSAVAVVLAAGALIPVGRAGTHQADRLDGEWANSNAVIGALSPLVTTTHLPVLMDQSEIAAYYLERQLALPAWVNTFFYSYTPPGSHTALTGVPAYTAAVDNGVFGVIALDYGTQVKYDHAIAAAIHESGRYKWVGNFKSTDEFGRDTYIVWRLRPATAGQGFA